MRITLPSLITDHPIKNIAIIQVIGTQKTSDRAIQSTIGRNDAGTKRNGKFTSPSVTITVGLTNVQSIPAPLLRSRD